MQYRKMLHTLLSYTTGREASIDNILAVGDWRFIQLGHRTSVSPLAIPQGTTTKLTFQPSDISYTEGRGLVINYDHTLQKFMPQTEGDVFLVEVRFKAKCSSQNGHFDVLLESPTFAYNPVQSITTGLPKAANVEQFISLSVPIFIGADVMTNGLEVKVKAEVGNLSVYDISYIVVRIGSGLKV